MKNKIKILLACLFFYQITITPKFDIQDCLNMAQKADKENNSWFGSTEEAQLIIRRMRDCKCAQRTRQLDQHTNLHRSVERACINLASKAQSKIDTWFPDENSRKQAITSMQIAEALGSEKLARYSSELQQKCYDIKNQERRYLRNFSSRENDDRLYLIRLLKRAFNCY